MNNESPKLHYETNMKWNESESEYAVKTKNRKSNKWIAIIRTTRNIFFGDEYGECELFMPLLSLGFEWKH